MAPLYCSCATVETKLHDLTLFRCLTSNHTESLGSYCLWIRDNFIIYSSKRICDILVSVELHLCVSSI